MDCGNTGMPIPLAPHIGMGAVSVQVQGLKEGLDALSVQQQHLEQNSIQGNSNGNGLHVNTLSFETISMTMTETVKEEPMESKDLAQIGLTTGNGDLDSSGAGADDRDSNRFFSWSSHSSNKATMPVSKDSDVYNMNHTKRGKAVIFNHENFHPSLDLGRRFGTERDKIQLKSTLTSLGFEVHVFDDLTFQEIRAEVEKLAKDDHKDRDCVIMCVLSHGDTQLMYAKDYSYKPDILWQSFTADKCPTLAGKPKLFFVQACQGNNLDDGTKLVRVTRTQVDSSPQSYRIPNHADFLIAFSTVPGFYSWRNTTNGSWFIQALCTVLKTYGNQKDLLSMMTIVAREVALNFESNTPSTPHMHQKKQIPFITSTLIRDVYLVPK